jgi:hypothetical protein
MRYKDKDRYVVGFTDPRAMYSGEFLKDYIRYKIKMSNWLPPKYTVVKYVNGAEAQIMVSGVSKEVAEGYVKLLEE